MVINSIQRGTISIASGTTSATATVTAVDPTKAELSLLGGSRQDNVSGVMIYPRIALTNSTTITANVSVAPGGGALILSWELVEYA